MDTSTGAWRRWIWIFVVVQLVGLVTDAAWHGLLSRGVEPETLAEMVGHLATVHLPLYIGVLGLFVTAIWAAADPGRRAAAGLALPLVVARHRAAGGRSLARVLPPDVPPESVPRAGWIPRAGGGDRRDHCGEPPAGRGEPPCG